MKITELGKSKSKGVTSMAGVKGGPASGFQTGQSRVGVQQPGQSGVSRSGSNSTFGVKGGSNSMFGKQSVQAAGAGRAGKGGVASGPIPTGGRKRYADDANGAAMGGPGSKSS